MANILMDKFTVAEVKKHITALNAVAELPAKAPTGGGKEKLAKGFVDAITAANDAGEAVLNLVPEEVWNFYTGIMDGETKEDPADGQSDTEGAKDTGTTDTETGTDKPKPPKRTRGTVFATLLPTLEPGKRDAWAEEYWKAYGVETSEAESKFRVGVYADLLIAMGLVTEDSKRVLTYVG
jgi:hypothetical protein